MKAPKPKLLTLVRDAEPGTDFYYDVDYPEPSQETPQDYRQPSYDDFRQDSPPVTSQERRGAQ